MYNRETAPLTLY